MLKLETSMYAVAHLKNSSVSKDDDLALFELTINETRAKVEHRLLTTHLSGFNEDKCQIAINSDVITR